MIEFVLERLASLPGKLSEMGRDRRELRDNALRAVSHALNETYLYYRDVDAGKGRNMDTEAQLSRYWSAAAIPLRHVDNELALLCEHKSEYWVNPESWDNGRIEQLGINLKDMRKHYRYLLYPNLRPKRLTRPGQKFPH